MRPRRPRARRAARVGMQHCRRFRRLHPALYTAGLVVTTLVVGAGSMAALTVNEVNQRIAEVDISAQVGQVPVKRAPTVAAKDPTDPFGGQAINIAVFGSDSRMGANGEVTSDGVEGARADVTMIVHVAAARDRVEIVSIPRDTTVTIPPCTLSDGTETGLPWTTKFNAAFARGGEAGSFGDAAACAIKTVHEVAGLPIDEFVVVDFTGFITMVDALGGVELCLDHAVKSKLAKLNLKAGCHHLPGKTALAYARARTGTGLGDGSDLMRLERQHQLLGSVAQAIREKNLLTSAADLYHFATALAESVTVSPGLGSVQAVAGLAFSLRNLEADQITTLTAPYAGDPDNPENVVLTDQAQAVFNALAEDRPLPD